MSRSRHRRARGCKKLIVYVEIDRCATDAVQAVTGCSLGKRTLKFLDYGKMAMTFVNTETEQAVRVLAKDDARALVPLYVQDSANPREDRNKPIDHARRSALLR